MKRFWIPTFLLACLPVMGQEEECPACPASTVCAEIAGVLEAGFDWNETLRVPVDLNCVGIAGGPVVACPTNCSAPSEPVTGAGVIAGRLELSGGPEGREPWLARNAAEGASLSLGRLQGIAFVDEFGCQYLDGVAVNGAWWLLCSAATGQEFHVFAHDQRLDISLIIYSAGGKFEPLHDFSTFKVPEEVAARPKSVGVGPVEAPPPWAVELCQRAGECP